ncbi:FAR1-related protein [Sesbania bispinosa]|nr:FAR1-related protein [Sesbania bispinosa]
MLDQFPTVMHDFIESVVDVARDGNCGYRAISALLGMGEESWPIIRQELHREVCYWHHDYATLFGDEQSCYQLRNSLLVDGRTSVSVDKWMTLPDMGYVIASRYNVMLVSLSIDQSMTFFPLRGHPPPNHKILCIGYVDGNHWVQVFLKEDSPLPPTAIQWRYFSREESRAWEYPYYERMVVFSASFANRNTGSCNIILD